MDPWKELAAWQDWRDCLRIGAELEAKNPLMTDDLHHRCALERYTRHDAIVVLSLAAKLIAWVAEVWRAVGRS